MAPTRNVSKEQPLQVSIKLRDQFVFPKNSHLLITTPSQVSSWDSSGIHTLFRSTKKGIVAATEPQDESGVLAVADKHVVVLHDTKRGREKSWGLDASGDEVRHLQYTTDAKSLFFSTSLTSDIQHYSVEQSRLLSPAKAHASPPVALAVSPSGHLTISASDGPPVVYLKNLTHNIAPVLMEPRASRTAVTVAVFHPERPNIFLLAFRDGSIAAYDANKILRSGADVVTDQESVNKGEISHLTALHRAAPARNNTASIPDAAFLPGFKSRAVSVGTDGRCRIIDFADGGVILRTWHAKAPVASVSVLSGRARSPTYSQTTRSAPSQAASHAVDADNLIAIGRTDGLIHVYDSVGLLLCERAGSDSGEKIISVKWAHGPSPSPIIKQSALVETQNLAKGDIPEPYRELVAVNEVSRPRPVMVDSKTRRDTMFEHVGLPPGLRKSRSPMAKQTSNAPTRQFTIHPDEVEEGTVQRTVLSEASKDVPVVKGDYLDLFSPVKPPGSEAIEPAEKRMASPPHSRPAITSQTFIKSPEAEPTTKKDTLTRQRNLALFPSTDSGSEMARAVETGRRERKHTGTKTLSPQAQRKRITFEDNSRRNSRRNSSFKATATPINRNAKVLADLRKMSNVHPAYRSQGTLSNFAPSKARNDDGVINHARPEEKSIFKRRSAAHVETDLGSAEAHEAYELAHRRRHWPEDSIQDTAPLGDIWLTSESDRDTVRTRRKQHHSGRPPARQTSRSRVDSKGTASTLLQQPTDTASVTAQRIHRLDGSTEEEMFTAGTHVTSNGTLSPSSADIQTLFPRTSSLSPRKRHKSKKGTERSPKTQDKNLREVAPNVAGRISKSPWARARAGKLGQNRVDKSAAKKGQESVEIFYDPECNAGAQKGTDHGPHCASCGPTNAKVKELEAQVSRLKGEILVCKAMLRRQGVLLPGNMRPR